MVYYNPLQSPYSYTVIGWDFSPYISTLNYTKGFVFIAHLNHMILQLHPAFAKALTLQLPWSRQIFQSEHMRFDVLIENWGPVSWIAI